MSLKLHHLNASRSQRIVWLLAELGIPHEIVPHQRNAQTRLGPPELLSVHPLGKAPLLEHDGVVIAETGAITQYLLAKFDPDHRLHPHKDNPDFPRYLEWLHAAEGAVFLPGLMRFYLMSAGLLDQPIAALMAAEQDKASNHIEAHLSRHAYFAGERFSAADCLMGFQLNTAAAMGQLENRPASKAWLAKVQAREAYAQMLAVGV